MRSEDFVLKADINKLFLLCCVFSEIIKVYEIHGGKAHFLFYQVTKSNFSSFIKYCLKIMSLLFSLSNLDMPIIYFSPMTLNKFVYLHTYHIGENKLFGLPWWHSG